MPATSTLIAYHPMTEREFGIIFAKLAMQLGVRDADIATIKSYYEALGHLPQDAIRATAADWAQVPGQKWFPTTGEWLGKVQAHQHDRLRAAVKPARDEPWRHECEQCEDTGWVIGLTCDGGLEQWPEQAEPNTTFKTPWRWKPQARATETPRPASCDRTRPHGPHTYTVTCSCRPTNRTWRRHQAFGKGD